MGERYPRIQLLTSLVCLNRNFLSFSYGDEINDNNLPLFSQVLYLALEKRYNFSFSDLDVVANGYSHFCSYLRDEKGKHVTI